MTPSRAIRSGSLRRLATRQFDEASVVRRLRSRVATAVWAEDATRPTFILATAVLAAALVVSIIATAWKPSVVPDLAPDDPDGTMTALWQVHAAVVALGVPLLVLLIEQARSRTVIATSPGPALVSRSAIVFTTAFSLGAVVEIGLVTLYLRSDGALATSFVIATVSVLLILWAYASALSLLLSPRRLRAQSLRLLERRLRSSMLEAFIEDRMNLIVIEKLDPWDPRHLGAEDVTRNEDWQCALAASSGRIVDVELRSMLVLLRRFVPLETARASGQPNPDAPKPADEIATRLLVRPIGDRVRTGDVLLAIGGLSQSRLPLDGLASLYRIERDGL